jgi:hypothetical protein
MEKNKETLDSSTQEVYNTLSANKFKSESGHWYTQEGDPMYTVIGANGKERNTTLRDAKKDKLVPSVTTVLGMIAKPSLENWKINQALNSAMTLEKDVLESVEEFAYRCKIDSKKIGQEAAKKGTEIHAMIERGFLGEEETETYCVIKNYLNDNFPDEEWIAEASFCADLGYGGKIDLYSKSGIFVDFKTKDNLEGKDPAKLVYDEHGMQLSAYAQGCGFNDVERVSIFVDREDTELIACHIWDRDTQKKHTEMFNSILQYWKLVKNYDSSNTKEIT